MNILHHPRGQFLGLWLLLLATGCQNPATGVTEPRIVAFGFSGSSLGLGADVVGQLDEAARTVTVAMPASVTDWSALTPQIQLAAGTSLLSPSGVRDFTQSPLSYSVSNGAGRTAVYLVTLKKAVTLASDTAVLFSEYYSGSAYTLKGDNNQYLELTNTSASAVDLSQYSLVRHVWQAGVRKAEQDCSVALKGTLSAGASLVLYSNRLNTATFSTIAALTSLAKASDKEFNTVVSFSGYDGYQLVRDGTVLDVLGPNHGVGSGLNWGTQKRMLRKIVPATGQYRLPTTQWNEDDWTTYAVDGTNADAVNAGLPSTSFASTDTKMTYFAFEGLPTPAYGIIDQVAHKVTIAVPDGTEPLLSPTVSTQGLLVWYQGDPIVSGQTKLDFSRPVSLRVVAADSSYKDYQVTREFYRKLGFTTTNYGFSGGIADAVAAIKAGGAPNSNGSDVSLNTTLEGIVTSKDVYWSSAIQHAFTIQDKDAGIFFYVAGDPLGTIQVGRRVKIAVTTGKNYYDMPEITAIGAVTAVDSQINDLYYQTGNFNFPAAINQVYRWTGSIEEGMVSYVGTFEGDLYFHSLSALTSSLTAGTNASFYGPVSYSFSKYRMEIAQKFQIVKP